MTVRQLRQRLGLALLAGEGVCLERPVTGCYAGDLLIWVMGKAKQGDVWITVMGGVNSVAVAVMNDLSCILLAEDAPLDSLAQRKAVEMGVAVLGSSNSSAALAAEITGLLRE